jgi:hypothetical protein
MRFEIPEPVTLNIGRRWSTWEVKTLKIFHLRQRKKGLIEQVYFSVVSSLADTYHSQYQEFELFTSNLLLMNVNLLTSSKKH